MATTIYLSPGKLQPRPEVVARRGQPRGLWKELARIDADNRGHDFWDSREAGLGMLLRFVKPLIMDVGGDLNAVLEPYDERRLLEQHGAVVFYLFIRLASEESWGQWILLLLEVSASGRSAIDCVPRAISSLPRALGGSAVVVVVVVDFTLNRMRGDQYNITNLLRRVVIVGHNTEVLLMLLENDVASPPAPVGVREVDDTGYSSLPILSFAVSLGDRSMVVALIKAGTPLEFQSRHSRAPLAIVVASDRDKALGIVHDLLAAGADVNNAGHNNQTRMPIWREWHQLDSRGRSALHVACRHNCEGAVKLLLQYDARVTLLCDDSLSPFDVVAVAVLKRRQLSQCWRLRRRPDAEEGQCVGTPCLAHPHAAPYRTRSPCRGVILTAAIVRRTSIRRPNRNLVQHRDEGGANDGGCELPVHVDIDLGGASPRGMARSEAFEGRTGHSFTL
ncbi:unnamed protein product [Ectocarpus sp. CCAP 1310/34]|nr:unnamed protein product [Ectocarpus sp. CCAP 1310/34]